MAKVSQTKETILVSSEAIKETGAKLCNENHEPKRDPSSSKRCITTMQKLSFFESNVASALDSINHSVVRLTPKVSYNGA